MPESSTGLIFVAAYDPPKKTAHRLLICEGFEDFVFFRSLIKARALPEFHLRDTATRRSRHGGIDKFGTAISAADFEFDFKSGYLKNLLLVADNDDDPDKNFKKIQDQIRSSLGASWVPTAPQMAAGANPAVTVLMLPAVGESGNLECFCLPAAKSIKATQSSQVTHFLDTVHADRWKSDSRRGKAWLRSKLAITCESDPFISLGRVFEEFPELIPLKHRSFNDIANFLAKL